MSTRFDRMLSSDNPPAIKVRLREGGLYRFKGKQYEFSGMGSTGLAILHPPGEPDMQSCIAVRPEELEP